MDFLKKIFDKLEKDHVSEYAAECAYFTILSFIPFIIFFLTLIQYTNVDKEIIMNAIKYVIPSIAYETILNIIQEVYSKSAKTLSIAVFVALWSAGKGFFSLSKGLRYIYDVKEKRNGIISRLESTFYTLILIIALIGFLIVVVFGNRISMLLSEKIIGVDNIMNYILKSRFIISIILMFIVFLMIYRFIPKHSIGYGTQVYGAIFSSIVWYIISYIFSIYVDIFKGFSNTYGSLTSIILIMMWVYVCMYVVLIGAEINVFIREYKLSKMKLLNK